MENQKFAVRLLGKNDELLAWAEVMAAPKVEREGGAASCPFFATAPTFFEIEQDGVASRLSIQWCDIDTWRVTNLPEPTPVVVGQCGRFDWFEPVWLIVGMRDVPRPEITVKTSVGVAPLTGTFAAH